MPAPKRTMPSHADGASARTAQLDRNAFPAGIDADQLASYVKRAIASAPPLSRAQADALATAWHRPRPVTAGDAERLVA